MQFERVHRMGEYSRNNRYPRKLVAKFASYKDKEAVRRQSGNLKDTDFFLHEQFPPDIAARRRALLPALKTAKREGKRAWLSTFHQRQACNRWRPGHLPHRNRKLAYNRWPSLAARRGWRFSYTLECTWTDYTSTLRSWLFKNYMWTWYYILYELWGGKCSKFDIDGFKWFNFYRKFQNCRAKRNSGGIVLYIRNSLCNGVSVVRNHFDPIIWLKLDKLFFNFTDDVYIAGVYMWVEGNLQRSDLPFQ